MSAKSGPFGPIFTGYRNNPQLAIQKLLKEQDGEVPDAFVHSELGNIAFVYGNDKAGLKKIKAKHGQAAIDQIADVLRNGRLVRDPKWPRAYVVLDGSPAKIAVIRLDWDGAEKTWLVSSFEDARGKFAGGVKTSDTGTFDSTMTVLVDTLRTVESLDQLFDSVNLAPLQRARLTAQLTQLLAELSASKTPIQRAKLAKSVVDLLAKLGGTSPSNSVRLLADIAAGRHDGDGLERIYDLIHEAVMTLESEDALSGEPERIAQGAVTRLAQLEETING